MNQAIAHHYRRFREHQRSFWNDGGSLTIEPSGRTEHTFGGAAYGLHAVAAFLSAKRHIAFKVQLSADIKASRKRSKAAKQGWKTRRAA